MAKFDFGKTKNNKNKKQEELNKELETEKGLDEDLDSFTGFDKDDGVDGDFFDDDFGIVESPSDEDDLETEARKFSVNANNDREYSKAEPKWYEKGANIITVIVILAVTVISVLFIFREPIRGLVGSGTEEIRDVDIQGEVQDYKEGVKDTLKEDSSKEKESEAVVIEEVETLPAGEYTVGKDISPGIWIAKDVLLEIYNNKEEYEDNKSPMATNVNSVREQKVVGLNEGQYIVVQSGELVFNDSRAEVAVNVGDTFNYDEGTQLFVGKDIQEGFYSFYNLDILEKEDMKRVRDAKVILKNATEEEPSDIGIERKTTVFLRKGLIIEIKGGVVGERVSSDGTFGDDQDLLNGTETE